MNRLPIMCVALVLAACNSRDVVMPRTTVVPQPPEPTYQISPKVQPLRPSRRPPDVQAAHAAEIEALNAIKKHVPELFPKLGLESSNSLIGSTNDPHLAELIAKYYEARYRRQQEEQRQEWVDAARRRGGIPVVVALGEPRDGALAEVIRRPHLDPSDVIVLAAGATPDALGAALATLEQSRANNGDLLPQHMTMRTARAGKVNAARQSQLAHYMEELRNAEPRPIKGLGTVKALTVRSSPALPSR